MCEKSNGSTLFFSGVCAELPPGAFRVSGRFHSRGWSQRVILPQSPDPTCGGVILQCLRWQRSFTIYGEIYTPTPPVSQSIIQLCVSRLNDWALNENWPQMCVGARAPQLVEQASHLQGLCPQWTRVQVWPVALPSNPMSTLTQVLYLGTVWMQCTLHEYFHVKLLLLDCSLEAKMALYLRLIMKYIVID